MTDTQLSMFAEPAAPERCATCRTERPADYPRKLWLEPVSGECSDCNMATLREIFTTGSAGQWAEHVAAWTRHLGGKTPKSMRRSRP